MTLSPGTVGSSRDGSFPATPIFNALIPREGPRMVPFTISFPDLPEFEIDLTITVQQKRISVIQTVFIDTSACDQPVRLSVFGTLETIHAAPGSQGYYPLLVPDTPKFTISSSSSEPCILIFLNVPVPASVWNSGTTAAASQVIIQGPLAGAAPATGDEPVLITQAGGVTTWTSHSAATANPAASTELLPAVGAGTRYIAFIKAPESDDLWVNRIGGSAAINGLDCFKIPASAVYITQPGESCSEQWNYFCATTGANYTALTQEGN